MKNSWEKWRTRLITISLAIAVIGTMTGGIYRGYLLTRGFTKDVIKKEVSVEIQCFKSKLSTIEINQNEQSDEMDMLHAQIKENNSLVRKLILVISNK